MSSQKHNSWMSPRKLWKNFTLVIVNTETQVSTGFLLYSCDVYPWAVFHIHVWAVVKMTMYSLWSFLLYCQVSLCLFCNLYSLIVYDVLRKKSFINWKWDSTCWPIVMKRNVVVQCLSYETFLIWQTDMYLINAFIIMQLLKD